MTPKISLLDTHLTFVNLSAQRNYYHYKRQLIEKGNLEKTMVRLFECDEQIALVAS